MIWTWGIAAVGYLMRPIGGFIYGFLGDRYGRRPMLFVSIVGMGLPTIAIGLLPTYATSGALSWALLLTLRLIQGLCVGGEFPGSRVYLVEHAPTNHRGLMGSMQAMFAAFGVLLASGLGAVVTAILTRQEVIDWGWRIPFLFSAVIVVIGVVLRIGIPETPVYRRLSARGAKAPNPIKTVFQRNWGALLRCAALVWVQAVSYVLPAAYLSTWFTTSGRLTLAAALTLTTISQLIAAFFIPLGGWLSDRYGRRPIMIWAALAMCLLSVPLFLWMTGQPTSSIAAVLVSQIVVLGLSRFYEGPLGTLMAESFPPETRTAGVAVSYNLAAGLLGGTTALFATWLVAKTDIAWSPACYLVAVSIIGVIVLLFGMRETAFRPLPDGNAEDVGH